MAEKKNKRHNMELEKGILFARQEIFDSRGKVSAYELLYRNGNEMTSNIDFSDPNASDNATSFVLSHLFTQLDFDVVLGTHPAFINFSKTHLLREIPQLLPKDRVVIEILENMEIDNELIRAVHSMSNKGYKFALDDFVYHDDLKPLIEIAKIIKIDVLNLSEKDIEIQLEHLKGFKGKLLAEKVETREEYHKFKELGFDYFQGYFFNKPDLVKGQKISQDKSSLLHLLSEINNPDIALQAVEEAILRIPKLSYRILRLVNSAALYSGRKIDSLMDAIKQMGLGQIGDWVCLLLFSSIDEGAHGLLEKTLIRAKMCESLARQTTNTNYHQAFTVGILSTIDSILNESMAFLLSKISLSEELNKALLEHEGELGDILAVVLRYEKGQFETIGEQFKKEDILKAYMDGLAYSNQVLGFL